MHTVKVKNIFKYLAISILMFFTYTNVHAIQESVLTFSNTEITQTVSGSGYTAKGTNLTINDAGVYRITGSCDNGSITVKKGTKDVTLILDNLNLTGVDTAPLTINKENGEISVILTGINYLSDNENPENEFSSDNNVKDLFEGAAIKVKDGSSLTISGTGTLNLTTINKNGIKGGDNSIIKVNDGNLDIESTGNGISSDHKIFINGGHITILAGKEGIKASPDEVAEKTKGEITINGGTINVNAGEDGIQSEGNIIINNRPNITVTANDDGIQTRSSFTMNNGILDIYTFEGHTTNNFDKDVMSAKGIKASTSEFDVEDATNEINIYGGEVTIDSSDDALHSDGDITLTNGRITISSWDDGIHADSKLTFGTTNGYERDPYINILTSNEGIEAANIYFYSGKIKVKSRDDGINAAGGASSGEGQGSGEHFNPNTGADNFAIYSYGNNVNVYVDSGFDGLDANGSIYLYGGNFTIYSQGRGGTNSSLDRDAHLVIDGATVFTSGSIGTNGLITNIESNQKFVDLRQNKNQGDNVAIKDNDTVIFNDTLIKDTEYIFYTSPTLSSSATIEDVNSIQNDLSHAWIHPFDDGVITTPATIDHPGVITYTCAVDGEYQERITYYYDNNIRFNIKNRTNGNAKVTIGDVEGYYDFTTLGATPMVVESTAPVYLVSLEENSTTYNKINPTSVEGITYTFELDSTKNQDLYVIYRGDTNTNGYIASYDELLIRKSLLETTDQNYRSLSQLEAIASDADDDGDIDEDDIIFIQNAQAYLELNYSFLNMPAGDNLELTNSGDITLDGINPGTVDIYIKAPTNVKLDSLEAMIIKRPNFTVKSITPLVSGGTEFTGINNGLVYLVKTDGYNIQAGDNLFKVTLEVAPNTPTGDYDIDYVVGVFAPNGESNYERFGITTQVHVNGVTSPYVATFVKDSGVKKINVYRKKNSTSPEDKDVSYAYARDGDSGDIITNGNGQVNFEVKLEDGYIISSVTIDEASHYNNIKSPAEVGAANQYRITKISGDIVVTITTKIADKYDITFNKNKGINRVDYYYTHDYTTPDESDVVTVSARNESTGEIDISGNGQANFKVIVKDGYKLNSVTADGSYKNLKSPAETGVDNLYRITKISGDIIVNVEAIAREAITLDIENLETSYEFAEGPITPEIVVKKAGTDTILVKDVDYALTYGENTLLGQGNGSITIKSINTSDYKFSDRTVYFDIVEKELDSSNVTVQNSIAFTGNILSPKVVVNANNKRLVQDQDYEVSFTNQDASINDYVYVNVVGTGNYTGSVLNIPVQAVNKEYQTIEFADQTVTVKYGQNFIKTANLIDGDGEVFYSSSNPDIATVNPFTGAVVINKKGSVVIKATAAETDNYAETSAQYTLIIEPTNIYVQTAIVEDKTYDKKANATVSSISLIGNVNDYNFVEGTDYTYTASFEDANVGENKNVTITVTLDNSVLDRFVMATDSYETTASITPAIIESSNVTLDNNSFTYDGNEKTPVPTIIVGENTLVKNTDYTVSYENNTNAGTGYVIINAINNYKTVGELKIPFTINKLEVTPNISNIDNVTYNASEQTPDIIVTDNNITLEKDIDYTVKYENNINAGEAKVKIIPVSSSNYTFDSTLDNATKTFNILPYSLTSKDIKLEYYYVKYDGNEKEPEVTVTANQITLDKDIDYKVEYSNNTNIGTSATVTITPLSFNYTNAIDVNFEITGKEVINISGISDNQKITYTGEEVVLNGNINVASNTLNITKDDLTIKYYNSNNEEISRPINVGSYYVIYSYDSSDAVGEYKVNFKITKAKTNIPSEMYHTYYSEENNLLSSVDINLEGFSWVDSSSAIIGGYNAYNGNYTKNNDPVNYESVIVPITIYGKKRIDITTSVNGEGGSISSSISNVLEGEEKTIYFTPYNGYQIKNVIVNGTEVGISNNELTITAEKTDLEVIVTFETITYDLNIVGRNVETDPNGIIVVNYSSSKDIKLTTKSGYRLTSVTVNDTEKISDVSNNTIVIPNITDDTIVVAQAKKIEYEVTEGARQTYTINESDKATFIINADFELFNNGGKVYIDDKLVSEDNYTSKAGSTVITFNKSYFDTLEIGIHTLNIKLSDGGIAQTTFTISKVTTRTIVDTINSSSIVSSSKKTNNSAKATNNTKTNSNNNTDTKDDNIVDVDTNDNKKESKDSKKTNSKDSKKSKSSSSAAIYIIIASVCAISLLIIVLFKKDNEKDDF